MSNKIGTVLNIISTLGGRSIPVLELALRILPREKQIYFALASAYVEVRKWQKAVDIGQAVAAMFPEDLDVRWGAGVWLLQLNRPNKALEHLEFYLYHYPKDERPEILGNMYAILGHCYLTLDRLDEAESNLVKAGRLNPKDLDYCLGLVYLYGITDRAENVFGFLDKFIKDNPAPFMPYAWMASHIQYSMHNPQESLKWYQKALERIVDPENRHHCETFVSCRDQFDGMLRGYVDALISCGQSENVILQVKEYEKYQIDSDLLAAKRSIDFYVELNLEVNAEKFLGKLPRKIKKTPEIMLSRILLDAKMGRHIRAQRTMDKVLAIDCESHDVLNVLGSLQMKQEKWQAGLSTYEKMIKLSPYSVDLLRKAGMCCVKTGEYKRAREYFEKVLRYDKLEADTWIELADIYAILNENGLALSAYNNGLKLEWLSPENRKQAHEKIQLLGTTQ